MSDSDNWYAQDEPADQFPGGGQQDTGGQGFPAGPSANPFEMNHSGNPWNTGTPPRKDRTALWVVLIIFGSLLFVLVLGVALWLVAPAGGPGGGFPGVAVADDESLNLAPNATGANERVEACRRVYTAVANGVPQQIEGAAVSDAVREQIEQQLALLQEAMASDEEPAFRSRFDFARFRLRVRKSSTLAPTASFEFSQFNEWMEFYPPYTATRIHTLAVTSRDLGAGESEYTAHTLVYVGDPVAYRLAWVFEGSDDGPLVLVDYINNDQAMLLSDFTAREFSAAFSGTLFDNYLELVQWVPDETADEETIAAEWTRLRDSPMPASVRPWAQLNLMQTLIGWGYEELALQQVQTVRRYGDFPLAWFSEAVALAELGRYDEAMDAMRSYESLVGPGPDSLLKRAQWELAAGRREESGDLFLRALTMDPGNVHLPWELVNMLDEEDISAVAEALQASPSGAAAAVSIADRLSGRLTVEELLPLLELAEAGEATRPAALAARASTAATAEDWQQAEELYNEAIRLGGSEHEEFAWWVYLRSETFVNREMYADAVATSPLPAETFRDWVIDEGELYCSRVELRQYLEGLENAAPADPGAAEDRELWLLLGRGLLVQSSADDQVAWQAFRSAAQRLRGLDEVDPETGEEVYNSAAEWLPNWLAEAAVRTDNTSTLVNDATWTDSPAEVLADAAVRLRNAEALDVALSDLANDTSVGPVVHYFLARAAEFQGNTATAVEELVAYLKDLPEDDYWLRRYAYEARRSLYAQTEDDLFRLFDLLPATEAATTALPLIIDRREPAEVQAFLEECRSRGIPVSETCYYEGRFYASRRDWEALAELASRWLQQTAETPEPPSYYLVPAKAMVEGLVITDDYDAAERIVESTEGYYDELRAVILLHRDGWEATAAYLHDLPEEDRQQAIRALLNSDVSQTPLEASEVARGLQEMPSLPWQFFGTTGPEQEVSWLASHGESITSGELRNRLNDLSAVDGVEDLTSAWQANLQEWTDLIGDSTEESFRPAPIQCFRILSRHGSLIVTFCKQRYDQEDGAVPLRTDYRDYQSAIGDGLFQHESWGQLDWEDASPDLSPSERKSFLMQVAGRLAPESEEGSGLPLWIFDFSVMEENSARREAMRAGHVSALQALEGTAVEGGYLTAPVAGDRADRIDQLVQKLKSDGADEASVKVAFSASFGPGRMLVYGTVTDWNDAGGSDAPTVVVRIEESDLVPPSAVGQFVQLDTWEIMGWTAED